MLEEPRRMIGPATEKRDAIRCSADGHIHVESVYLNTLCAVALRSILASEKAIAFGRDATSPVI